MLETSVGRSRRREMTVHVSRNEQDSYYSETYSLEQTCPADIRRPRAFHNFHERGGIPIDRLLCAR